MLSENLANQSEAAAVECDRAEKKTDKGSKGLQGRGVDVGCGWAFTGQNRAEWQRLVGGVMSDDG